MLEIYMIADNTEEILVSECSLQSPDQCCVPTTFPPTTTNHAITTDQTSSSQATVQEQQNGVSLGIAIGLACVGFAVGGLVSCLLCVFVPNLYTSTTSLMPLRKKKQVDSGAKPSAPQNTQKEEVEGHLPTNDQRISHIYDGIEIPLSNGRQKVSGQNSKKINSLDKIDAITSPVYNEVSEEIIPSLFVKDHNVAYQTLKARRSENTYHYLEKPGNSVNNSIPDGQRGLGEERDQSANHTYFTLNPHNLCSDVTPSIVDGTDCMAHACVVLPENPSGREETEGATQHDYYVLQVQE